MKGFNNEFIIYFLFLCYTLALGKELIYDSVQQIIQPEELLIFQFDSRPLRSYWNSSARWNQHFSSQYGHKYKYITMKRPCSNQNVLLASPWCKVKAMYYMDKYFPNYRAYLFLDSDAIITSNRSFTHTISYITTYLNWDWDLKPVAFNQDGPGWSCKHALGLGYHSCLNSGSIFWIKSVKASQIFEYWWNTSIYDLSSSKFQMDWRNKWPWEQAQQYEVFEKFNNSIMLLSFPHEPFLPWTSKKNPKSQYPTDSVDPWCFSHWPGANCFITHFCASRRQKLKLIELYSLSDNINVDIEYLDYFYK